MKDAANIQASIQGFLKTSLGHLDGAADCLSMAKGYTHDGELETRLEQKLLRIQSLIEEIEKEL